MMEVSKESPKNVNKKMKMDPDQELIRHKENMLILQKFVRIREGNLDGVFFSDKLPSAIDVVEAKVKRMVQVVVNVTLQHVSSIWDSDLLSSIRIGGHSAAFYKSLFKSISNFILSIFDTEDLEREIFRDDIVEDWQTFYRTNFEPLKDDANLIKLIADGDISFDGSCHLGETDIGFFMKEFYLGRFVSCFELCRQWNFVSFGPVISVECLEALSRIGFGDVKDNESAEWSPLDLIYQSLYMISWHRRKSMGYIAFAAAYPLRTKHYDGKFSWDVIKLVEIAEGRRRFEGHRYISGHHILWAAKEWSKVGDLVVKFIGGVGSQYLVEEPATNPPYNIYISALTIAGDGVVVGVGQLVIAIVFEMYKRKIKKLAVDGSEWDDFKRMECVEEFSVGVVEWNKKGEEMIIEDQTNLIPAIRGDSLLDEMEKFAQQKYPLRINSSGII